MKYLFIQFILLFLAFHAPDAMLGQIDRSKAPEPGPAPEIKVGEYRSFELKNGLKVFVVENHKIPRIAYSFLFDMDPFTEGDSMGYTGIAGALLGTATTSRTKDQIDEEIDFIGATLNTSSGSMYGAALKKHNEKLLELMSDILLNPVFNQDELDKIKKQTISDLAYSRSDPASISEIVGDVLLYGQEHPYGEVTTEASVGSITLDMCEEFYHTYFRPNIAYLAIVGDITLSEAKKLTKKYFGDWEPGTVPEHSYATPKAPESCMVSIVDRPHAVQSVIKLAHPVNYTVGMEDYVEARVMNYILGGGATSRLFMNLREEHAYTYGSYSSLSQDKWVGSFEATADVRNEVTDSAVYQILYEIDRLRREPVTPEQVDNIKSYLSGTFALSLEQPGTVARFALNIARYGLPADYYANYLKYIEDVSPEDVQAAAQKYLQPDNCHIFIVGKSEEIADKLLAFSPRNTIDYYDVEGNWIDPADMSKVLPEGLTAEQVIEKYLSAIGGREKMESLRDITMKLDMDVQGMLLESDLVRKAPDKFIMVIRMGETILSKTVFDGISGRTSGMQGEQELEGDDLEKMKMQSSFMPELDYAGGGYTTLLQSIESVDGKEAYKIEIHDPLGQLSLAYYDTETGFRIMEEKTEDTPQGPMVQSSTFGDYREVDGILFPHSIILRAGPQIINSTVKLLEYNSGVDDSVFK